ncbi:MAG: hypothetical protein M1830_005039, partial [Pleopsidium flavum]
MVEVHRYVPGRNWDVLNDCSPLKLNAYQPDAKWTGDYYAVKRLMPSFQSDEQSSEDEKRSAFAQLATELRIL